MKQTISAVLLAMFLAAGCAQPHVTQFEYDNIRLDVSGRIIGGKAVAMVDYKPGIYYSIDRNNRQIQIDARLASVNQKDLKEIGIRDMRWLTNSGTLMAATNIKNTTPKKSPPFAVGGLVNIGGSIGGGSRAGGTRCRHGGLLADCEDCGAAGGGTGVKIPVIVGSAGKDNENVLSVSATFDLDESIDIKEGYVALDIQLRKPLNNGLRRRVVLMPVELQTEAKPSTPQVNESTVIALLRDNRLVKIEGLGDDQNEADIKKKTPILRDIPLLGKMFKSPAAKTTEQEIIIFITPHIMLDR